MKVPVQIDPKLHKELRRVAALQSQKQADVIRMALRAGLPLVASAFQGPRPEGYFAEDYPLPKSRLRLEKAMGK